MTEQGKQDESFGEVSAQSDTSMEQTGAIDNRTPLYRAFHAARYQRQETIGRIQVLTGRRLVCYVSGSKCQVDWDDTMPFLDLLHKVKPGESFDLLLHTPGGNLDAAEKIIRLAREKVGKAEFRIIVPDMAKSAGTLMVLGADRVLMSDASELGPIDPQVQFADSNGLIRWHSAQHYIDAYNELYQKINDNPDDSAARLLFKKIDPGLVKMCQGTIDRARTSAERLLRLGMFRQGGNLTQTANELLDTTRWQSHSQMISWEDAQDPQIGLIVDYHDQESVLWQEIWGLYCLQRFAIVDNQKLFESDYVSLPMDA